MIQIFNLINFGIVFSSDNCLSLDIGSKLVKSPTKYLKILDFAKNHKMGSFSHNMMALYHFSAKNWFCGLWGPIFKTGWNPILPKWHFSWNRPISQKPTQLCQIFMDFKVLYVYGKLIAWTLSGIKKIRFLKIMNTPKIMSNLYFCVFRDISLR